MDPLNTSSQTTVEGQIQVLPLHESPASASTAPPVDALYQPRPIDEYTLPLDLAIRLAQEDLAVQQGANIHDRDAMVRAAVTLEIRLRHLLAALDVERVGGAA